MHERLVAQQVRAAIAHLGDEEARVEPRRDRGGRPHSAARSVGSRFVEDPQARFFDGRNQAASELIAVRRWAAGEHVFVDDVDGELARDLPSGRATIPSQTAKTVPAGPTIVAVGPP